MPNPGKVEVREVVQKVEFRDSGPPGPPGPRGDPGPAGPASASVGGTWRHVQSSPLAVWTINHNLGFFPNVTAFDSAGTEIEGRIAHQDMDNMTISFFAAGVPVATGGEAHLS